MSQKVEEQANFCQSCKASEGAWAVINPNTNTLHRITFSESLAQLIIDESEEGLILERIRFHRGNRLYPGEQSRGIYGVVATKKDLVLRVPLRKELAEMYAEDDSRHLEEIFISRPNKVDHYD